MTFSLVVCTYMRPLPLLSLLNSVKDQVLYPNEILIIDGSTNNDTKEVIEQNKFKNLKYYKVDKINRGLTKQRNFGINKVGKNIDIICFLDDDIILQRDYFKALLNTYSMYQNAIGVGGYINNEITWEKSQAKTQYDEFEIDGFKRKIGKRNVIRKKLGLFSNKPPGFMPKFSNGLSVNFLPPSGKTYQVEYIMGGVSSFKKELLEAIKFSTFFEGYGLYEDLDFCLRVSRIGNLYINTNAQLSHFHDKSGRPNMYNYGKMVIRNGWYVWRVKYPKPNLNAKLKWNAIALVLTIIRFLNVINTNQRKAALNESLGRFVGWISLIFNKPKVQL